MMSKTPSAMIAKVLSPALQLWLHTQLEQVEDLQVKISGSNGQILKGNIPSVSLSSSHAVYQGLHLGQVQLAGERIHINLTQVIQGQPLRLLEPVQVAGWFSFSEAHLKASLPSPLLAHALTDLLSSLIEASGTSDYANALQNSHLSWQEVVIHSDQLILKGTITNPAQNPIPIMIRTGLQLASPHKIHLYPLNIEASPKLPEISLDHFLLDLGSQVQLEELSLTSAQLLLRGGLTIMP
ncbi:MAG: DUF2993 domain-containing protein [Cyanobacteria bacterium QH_9_48_43]|nr:MAG: DUF2993 domain-containing protein [Cyanobacteria bacterium QH_9_48_43]